MELVTWYCRECQSGSGEQLRDPPGPGCLSTCCSRSPRQGVMLLVSTVLLADITTTTFLTTSIVFLLICGVDTWHQVYRFLLTWWAFNVWMNKFRLRGISRSRRLVRSREMILRLNLTLSCTNWTFALSLKMAVYCICLQKNLSGKSKTTCTWCRSFLLYGM